VYALPNAAGCEAYSRGSAIGSYAAKGDDMQKRFGACLATIALAWLVGAAAVLADNGQGGTTGGGAAVRNSLNHFLTVTQAGDYSAHGVGMRDTGGSGTITVGDIPAGSTVTHAYLYWAILDDNPNPAFANGVFNGTPISGVSIGTSDDPCWPVDTTFSFRADVTGLVTPGGNGAYLLTGFGSGSVTALNEGATLVILYTDPAALQNRDIVIYNGSDTIDDNVASVSTTMTIPPVGSPPNARTTYIVADGQAFTDTTLFNDNVIDTNGFQASDGPLWDTDTFQAQIAPYVAPGDTTAKVGLARGTDCLVHVAQVFSATSQDILPLAVTLDPLADTNPVGTNHTVTATVTGFGGQPAEGETVVFEITGSVNLTVACTTNANGQCSITYQGPPFPGADKIHAFVDENNSGTQDPGEPFSTPDATKVWVLPAPTPGCEVTISNGGWIITDHQPDGHRANFGGHARVSNGSDPDVNGNQEYQDKVQPINYHSNNVLTVVCSGDRTEATMFAEGTVNGAGTFMARISVFDDGEGSGATDTYDILVDNGYFSGEDRPLQGGNIQIQVHED
jgi:hypothetical protein